MKSTVVCVNEKCFYYKKSGSNRFWITHYGRYRRRCDSKYVQRFRCTACGKTFSNQTFNLTYQQHKPRVNKILRLLLCSKVSQRRIALILKIDRKTVDRKFLFHADRSRIRQKARLSRLRMANFIQMDEMETFEHSKCKPISIALAVQAGSRIILGANAAEMPAKGPLSEISRKRYGFRNDHRKAGFQRLLSDVRPRLAEDVWIVTDKKTAYPGWIGGVLPNAVHFKVKGRRGCIVGYGEMKKGGYDPLFWLNHTAAMVRDNLARMLRRTWCTTKKQTHLQHGLDLYIDFHNEMMERLGTEVEDREEYLIRCRSLGLFL